MMAELIDKLDRIETAHSDFFEAQGRSIHDYITQGIFNGGVFINTDLPVEIIAKVRGVFDNFSTENRD